METPIYEIIMLEESVKIDKFGWPNYGQSENVGFYYEEETAFKAVKENWCDINDSGKYRAAFVVQKIPGLYPITIVKGYFIYNKKDNNFRQAVLPKEWENFNIS